jgi:hypothetical protein
MVVAKPSDSTVGRRPGQPRISFATHIIADFLPPERPDTNSLGGYQALIAAGTLAIVGLLVLIVVILTSGDDDQKSRAGTSASSGGTVLEASSIGVRIRQPSGWTVTRGSRSISLRSPDRYLALSVSLPPGGKGKNAILNEDIAVIKQGYRDVRVGKASGRQVANLPAVSVVSSATNGRGTRIRILSAAAQGRRRAWLLQVFAANGAPRKRLQQAQNVVGTLHLSG